MREGSVGGPSLQVLSCPQTRGALARPPPRGREPGQNPGERSSAGPGATKTLGRAVTEEWKTLRGEDVWIEKIESTRTDKKRSLEDWAGKGGLTRAEDKRDEADKEEQEETREKIGKSKTHKGASSGQKAEDRGGRAQESES